MKKKTYFPHRLKEDPLNYGQHYYLIIYLKGPSYEKRIERTTLFAPPGDSTKSDKSPAAIMREKIVRRAACEFKAGLVNGLLYSEWKG